MSYQSIVEMVASNGLRARIAAAAADEGYPEDPVVWATQNVWHVVSEDSGWVAAWDSARANPSNNANPDTGVRDDVITDAMILTVVQPMIPGGGP